MSENNEQTETAESNAKQKYKSIIEGISEGLGSTGYTIARYIPLFVLLYFVAASVFEPLPLPQLTDLQTVFFIVLLLTILIFFYPVKAFIKRIYNPQKEIVVKVNVTDNTIVDWWYAAPELVDKMKVHSGKVQSFILDNKVVHLVTEFDPASNEAEGVDMKETTDWDMIYDPDVIEQHRWRNNAKYKLASRVITLLPDLGVEAEGKYHQDLAKEEADLKLIDSSYLDTFTDEMPSGDELESNIENAVQQLSQKDREKSTSKGDTDEQ